MTTESLKQGFDFKTIRSFEDACKMQNLDPLKLPELAGIPEEFRKPVITLYKLLIVFKAINNGWTPDWSNTYQYKYYPWFEVRPSGSGFSDSVYNCVRTGTSVGSRLCTDTSEKALYIANQFETEYRDLFLYSE